MKKFASLRALDKGSTLKSRIISSQYSCSSQKTLFGNCRGRGEGEMRTNVVQTPRRLLTSGTRFVRGSSTTEHWPKEYKSQYRPKTLKWPETTPLEVLDESGQEVQLSHVMGASTKPLLPYTMFESLERSEEEFSKRKALTVPFQGVSWTYKDLKERVESIALALLRLGVSKGDRIGVWLPNTHQWITLQYATAKIGAILVCVNPAYRAQELKHAVNLVGLKGLFFQGSIKSSNYVELLEAASPGISALKRSAELHLHDLPTLRFISHISDSNDVIPSNFPSIPYDEILVKPTSANKQAFDSLPVNYNHEPVNIQFTSGTTGLPKGSTLTHKNVVNNGYFVGEKLHLTHEDTVVTPVPMYHCFGCVMSNIAAITHGAHLVYPAPQFNAEATLQAVSDHKATVLHGVPTMFITERALPNFSDFDLKSLRSGILAGSSVPEITMSMVREDFHMKDVTICYGMTETSPVSLQTTRHDPVWARVETVGKVQDHLEVKLVDADGQTVPIGQSGEILTKGYSVMQGYWGNETATRNSIIDGWMHTGDLGTMDSHGYVRIIGRNKDMISRGGEKVYPREVEEFLYRHPAIQDVQIVGVPDSRLGEEIFAWVKLKSGHKPLTISDIASFCKDQIAHYKVPRYVECLAPGEDFPMTISGKIQKFILRERSVKSLASKGL